MKINPSKLKTQLFYFKVLKIMPAIQAACMLLLAFTWGIVDACTLQIIGIDSGFAAWLAWMLIGFVCSIAVFFFSSVLLSHKILQIYYLQKIVEEEPPVLNQD